MHLPGQTNRGYLRTGYPRLRQYLPDALDNSLPPFPGILFRPQETAWTKWRSRSAADYTACLVDQRAFAPVVEMSIPNKYVWLVIIYLNFGASRRLLNCTESHQ
jgi:hypothetical protein